MQALIGNDANHDFATSVADEFIRLKKLPHLSAQEFIVFQAIIAGSYSGKTHFSIVDVSNRLEISREAAKRSILTLAIKGLIERVPGGFKLNL
jgi:hypothetical protein